MIGKPKYKVGDFVSFVLEDKVINGSVYIVDKFGTFEDDSDVGYDIMTEDCLYKHINERLIL